VGCPLKATEGVCRAVEAKKVASRYPQRQCGAILKKY
jgi:hypothetical protein